MAHGFAGTVLRRGDEGYEAARRDTMWNAFVPDRHPDVIVQAVTEQDAVSAVRLARDEGLKIGVRSGGHSWAGNHVRDGGLLLDLSRLDEVTLDVAARTATLQPGKKGNALLDDLEPHGLFFPAGHCVGVGLGGYLLQGGYGWNGRVHGPACMSVTAIDVVTADGELVRASANEHPDLFWAARGSGPGFFGVVTRFHVKLYERPSHITNSVSLYAMEHLEAVFRWAASIGPDVERTMELMVFIHRDALGEPEIAVTGPVLAYSQEEADRVASILATCPAPAKMQLTGIPVTMNDLYAGAHAAYPDEHRYAVDNMWTHAPIDDLLPGLQDIADGLPGGTSHMLWMNWGPCLPERPDMAYSMEDQTYIALYAVWEDAAEDEACIAWATENMRAMNASASGIQLADENLGRRPARFVSDDHLARLDAVRAVYDPAGLFHPWMGRIDA